MKVIVPCAGRSSRYPDLPPKWTLPAHDGRPMLRLAVEGLNVDPDDLIITILREHEERFNASAGICDAFGQRLRIVVLDQPTRSQSETVAVTLRRAGIDGAFLVKDSDNCFSLDEIEWSVNYVCVESLNNFDSINPRNKSYAEVDQNDMIVNFREKAVISDLFSVGGYYFGGAAQFLRFYDYLAQNLTEWHSELYLSDVISAMILDGIPFQARRISGYQDWGTVHEWKVALMKRRVYYVLLDGFAFERGSLFFKPRFADTRPHAEAVAAIRSLAEDGHTIIYLSIRPAWLATETEAQIAAAELPPAPIVYGCPIAKWALVTAPHASLPFGTSSSFELTPSDPYLKEKLVGD